MGRTRSICRTVRDALAGPDIKPPAIVGEDVFALGDLVEVGMAPVPPDDDPLDLTDHVVATSEETDPAETVAFLFGTDQHGPDTTRDPVTEQFLEKDVTIGVEDYLLDEETRHELRFDDRIEYVPCVGDALIAAALLDHEPVTVRSLDPVTGEPVVFEVTDEDVDVTPPEHVVSIGMSTAIPDSETMISVVGSDVTSGRDYDDPLSHCQYVNAFESVETYERWAEEVDAVTIALPAEPLMAGTRRFAAGPVFD